MDATTDQQSAQASAAPLKIHRLPIELWIDVCSYLPRDDIRNVRLASKHLSLAATSALFSTVFLTLQATSFNHLLAISSDPALSKEVRHIQYDGREIHQQYLRMGRRRWIQEIGQGTPFMREPMIAFYKSLPKTDRDRIYRSFMNYARGQQYLQKGDRETALLQLALASFPNLDRISYDESPLGWRGNTSGFDLKNFSPLAQKIFFEPERGFRGAHHFWNIVEARTTSPVRLSALIGKYLSLKDWNKRATGCAIFKPLPEGYRLTVPVMLAAEKEEEEEDSDKADKARNEELDTVEDEGVQHLQCLSDLKILKLEFYKCDMFPESTSMVAKLLQNLPKLRVLRISFEELPWSDREWVARIPEVIYPNVTWAHLSNLSLQALYTSSNDLRGLMRRHAGTLRSLHLAHMTFSRPTRGVELESSWPSFFQFLHDELSLIHVRFDENFSNVYNEAWFTRNWDEISHGEVHARRYKKNCLRYRIERYVTHDGAFPFRSVVETKEATELRVKRIRKFWNKIDGMSKDDIDSEDDDFEEVLSEESMHRQIPWRFEADTSWRFESGILLKA